MATRSKVQFQPRWKEELVCTLDGNTFIIELTMGVLKVYLPTEARWEAFAPGWAQGQWQRVQSDLSTWCEQQNIPLLVEEHAWVEFD